MSHEHKATFTWGSGPQSVYVAGNFNEWSGDASALQKQADGTFQGQVSMPWGQKQAFKYVVDGEWKVREDEAKEWDAAGNMNNVYTAPPAPVSGAAASHHAPSQTTGSTTTHVPPTTAQDQPARTETTEPSSLLASSAPGGASSGSTFTDTTESTAPQSLSGGSGYVPQTKSGIPFVLGAVAGGGATTSEPKMNYSFSAPKETATAAVPLHEAPQVDEPTPVKIEKIAAHANIGEASAAPHEPTYTEQAAAYGSGILGAIGGVVGGAVQVVERATGVDILHTQPLSVDEATARGIDVDNIQRTDAATDAVAPVGAKPDLGAVDALEEKVQQLKVSNKSDTDVPSSHGLQNTPSTLPEEEKPEHDIPAQSETGDNHQHIPMPVITAVSERDPKKDRTLASANHDDTAGTKPVTSDPTVTAADAKSQAEHSTGATGSTPATADLNAKYPEVPTGASLPAGTSTVQSTAASANHDAPEPAARATSTTTPIAATPVTPVKSTRDPALATTPASALSTPASTPVKSNLHQKEGTAGSDVTKKKSNFFAKLKGKLSSKDK